MNSPTLFEREWIFELEKNQIESLLIQFNPSSIPDAIFDNCARSIERALKNGEQLSLKFNTPAGLSKSSETGKILKSVFADACTKLDVMMSVDPGFDRFDIDVSNSLSQKFQFSSFRIVCDCTSILRSSIKVKADADIAPNAINKSSFKSGGGGVRVFTAYAVNWSLEFEEDKLISLTFPLCVDKLFFVSAPFDEM